MEITRIDAIEQDFEFAFLAKKQAMGPYITSRWGWDEKHQRDVHTIRWLEKPWFILWFEGKRIGTVSIHFLEEHVRFGEFYLIDGCRNRGLGTKVLTRFLNECDSKNQKVILEYLKWNPVGNLYKRNGFKVTHENEIHYFLERSPVNNKVRNIS